MSSTDVTAHFVSEQVLSEGKPLDMKEQMHLKKRPASTYRGQSLNELAETTNKVGLL